MKKAVLFDLDGVLLDSMPYHVLAWQKVFSRYGTRIEANEIYSREGCLSADMARLVAEDHELNLSEPELMQLIQEKSKLYNELSRAEIMPGVVELIEELKRRRILIAIVTGTFRENLLRVMPAELVRQFNVIITGGDVNNGKPHPEPYLKAAEKLGLLPDECVVVENAELGIASGKAAGMFCLGVMSTQTAEQLKQADLIVSDLIAIRNRLIEIFGMET